MSKKSTLPAPRAEDHIVVFQEKAIRRVWDKNEWWFSVVDVCSVLTESSDAGAYWRKLKQRLGTEGSEVVTFCHGLKLEAPETQTEALAQSAAEIPKTRKRVAVKVAETIAGLQGKAKVRSTKQ